MPGFNGLGPNNSGAMTGKGRGYCMKEMASSGRDNFFGGYGTRRMNRNIGPRGRGFRRLGLQDSLNETKENQEE